MLILLWCILNWLLLFYFILLKGIFMKINFFYNFFNCVLDVNLWKCIVVSCYYFLLFEIKLIIKYWIFKKKIIILRGYLKIVYKI